MNVALSSTTTTSDRSRPVLRLRYWIGIAMASVFGADVGDFISRVLHLGHWRGVLPLALILYGVLYGRRRRWIGSEVGYWLAVILVRAGATNLADLADHDFDMNFYVLTCALFALFLASALWKVPSPSMRGDDVPGLPATGGSYWLSLFLAGALGTVLGDEASDQWGMLAATLSLSAVFACLLLFRKMRSMQGKAGYWSMILAARTAGTSAGDLIADTTFLGLAGSTGAMGLLMLATLWLWPRDNRADVL
jgi:uncharacterized membrane-anchored protein